MVVLFDGVVVKDGNKSVIFLSSNEAKALAANLEAAAEEADDHNVFELGLHSPHNIVTFHITRLG